MSIKGKEKITEKNPVYDLVNHNTGEIMGSYTTKQLLQDRKLVAMNYKYVRCTEKSLCSVFQLFGTKGKVFIWLLKHVTYSNIINGSQRHLAKKLNMSTRSFSRVLKILKEKKLIVIRTKSIVISPELFFYGNDARFLRSEHYFDKLLSGQSSKSSKSHSKEIKEGIRYKKQNEYKHMSVKRAKEKLHDIEANKIKRIKQVREMQERNHHDDTEASHLHKIIAESKDIKLKPRK